ncbi:primary amine oxidase-like protein [Tanacetum coccineum]
MELTDGTSSFTDNGVEGTVAPNTISGSSFLSDTATTSVKNDTPSSYANKPGPTSVTKANLRKLKANVPNDADYDVWLPLALVHEFSSIEGVDSVLRNGPRMIRGIPIFLNKWSPSASLLKEELSRVTVWVKFHDVPLVAYTSDGLILIATKIGTPMIACNDFSDNLVMFIPNLEGDGYKKETIRIEYEWVPPRCKGQTPVADDEGCIEVKKKKKSSGNNRGNKNYKHVLVKPKSQYHPKTKESTEGMSNSPKTNPFVGTNKASTSVVMGSKATTSEGKLVLLDDDGKPLQKVNYPNNSNSDDESTETVSGFAATPSEVKGDDITMTCDVVTITDIKKPLEDSLG